MWCECILLYCAKSRVQCLNAPTHPMSLLPPSVVRLQIQHVVAPPSPMPLIDDFNLLSVCSRHSSQPYSLISCMQLMCISSLSHSKADMPASVLLQLSAIWSLPMLATHPLFVAITATSAVSRALSEMFSVSHARTIRRI